MANAKYFLKRFAMALLTRRTSNEKGKNNYVSGSVSSYGYKHGSYSTCNGSRERINRRI